MKSKASEITNGADFKFVCSVNNSKELKCFYTMLICWTEFAWTLVHNMNFLLSCIHMRMDGVWSL